MTVKSLERDYLLYSGVKGRVEFSDCWGSERVPLVQQWAQDVGAINPRNAARADSEGRPR